MELTAVRKSTMHPVSAITHRPGWMELRGLVALGKVRNGGAPMTDLAGLDPTRVVEMDASYHAVNK